MINRFNLAGLKFVAELLQNSCLSKKCEKASTTKREIFQFQLSNLNENEISDLDDFTLSINNQNFDMKLLYSMLCF
jgi:hypothetical protein